MHRGEVAPLNGGTSPELEAIQVDGGKWDWNGKSTTTTDHDQRQLSKGAHDERESISKDSKTILLITRVTQIMDPIIRDPYLPMLNKIFLTSWVIAVLTDPLFLYIPTLNEDKKCLRMDKNLKILALSLRSITDVFYVLHIIFQLLIGFIPKASVDLKGKGFVKYALARARTTRWSYILIDVLAVLPVPQVVILVFFSKMIGPSTGKLMLYVVLLLQYAPRVVQIYLSCEELKKSPDAFTTTLWVRGAFNMFLYIMASHIIGAFWYFFSVQQEMECWHNACKSHIGCLPTSSIDMSCINVGNSLRNLTSMNGFCPTNPPNAAVFDFGIFLGAIESGILGSTDFPKKFLQSFWWGLRNLSSFGSNLETSRAWETCFAALISLLGLLLFLYLIGNLQLYMQLATQRSENKRYNRKMEIKRIMKAKEPDIDLWASSHKLREPEEVKSVIMTYMLDTLENDKQLNFTQLQKNLHSYLPHDQSNQQIGKLDMGHLRIIHLKLETIISKAKRQQWNNTDHTAQLWMLRNSIPRHVMPMIKKYVEHRFQNHDDHVDLVNLLSVLPVPLLQNVDDEVLKEIIKHLKPVTYAENSYIVRKGEPIGFMLFVTNGVVLIFGDDHSPAKCIAKAKGDYYGDELVEWQLKSGSYSELPISTANVQSHTKVEGLALRAVDLKHVLSKYWWKIPISTRYELVLLKRFAVNSIGEAWQRCLLRRQRKDQLANWTAVKGRLKAVTAWNIN
ncbi:Voltage dependent potassium channel [Parasponia andersonii]|uniref:Voltage dependent potassium channel n=1 Tax=Parasponia andersonii TaxID=3476 RepID=A0A2P5BMU8_PARAD|nr:Voltage dependent potassium channel [Parasponia andersonii]